MGRPKKADRPRNGAFADGAARAKRGRAAELLRPVPEQGPSKGLSSCRSRACRSRHRSSRCGRAYGLAHGLPKPAQPWPTGQLERLPRWLKEATVCGQWQHPP
jgi:hypothetical protein